MHSLIEKFNEGGIFMYGILALGFATIAILVERTRTLYFRTKTVPAGLRKQLVEFIQKGEFAHAEKMVNASALDSSLGRIAALGCHIRANGGGEEELQARMDERLNAEVASIDKMTGFLATFGNVATLVGLLGTISGMITSFAAVSQANPADRSILLSKGISEAMNCTAFGLLVAIPALVAYALFQSRTEKLTGELIESTTQVYNDLLFLTESDRRRSKSGT